MSKHGEYSERLYDEERKLRIRAENKCSDCPFVKHTKVAIINKPAEPQTKRKRVRADGGSPPLPRACA